MLFHQVCCDTVRASQLSLSGLVSQPKAVIFHGWRHTIRQSFASISSTTLCTTQGKIFNVLFFSFSMIYFHLERIKIFPLQYSESTCNAINVVAMPLNGEENTRFMEQCECILSKVKLYRYILGGIQC